jgi:hypothetical protein
MLAGLVMKIRNKQQGLALLLLVFFLALAATVYWVKSLESDAIRIAQDKITAASLAQAKAALIGYALSRELSNTNVRLGELPCPDTDDDGLAETNCGSAAGSNQARRLGRLPWKDLGLTDLRDGHGERLWYAVSNNVKNNTKTACSAPGPGCLNSDTNGTITVRNTSGTVIHDGNSSAGGVIAVIFAPGAVITRQDGLAQTRECNVGVNCDFEEVCTTSPHTLTPKCNPSNYLDIFGVEDNASFVDSNSVNGFITGPIIDASGNIIVNDHLLNIRIQELAPLMEKRVAIEVLNCLKDYALQNYYTTPPNSGIDRHPWTTSLSGYTDVNNNRFGRIPDVTFDATVSASANLMRDSWSGSCNIYSPTAGWWPNWKELVFYAVAWDKDPSNSFTNSVPDPLDTTPPIGNVPSSPNCDDDVQNDCLTIITPSGNLNHKKVAVIVAGRRILAQVRTTAGNKQTLSNYLEGNNILTSVATNNLDGQDTFFEQNTATSTFNDYVVYY